MHPKIITSTVHARHQQWCNRFGNCLTKYEMNVSGFPQVVILDNWKFSGQGLRRKALLRKSKYQACFSLEQRRSLDRKSNDQRIKTKPDSPPALMRSFQRHNHDSLRKHGMFVSQNPQSIQSQPARESDSSPLTSSRVEDMEMNLALRWQPWLIFFFIYIFF